MGQMGQMGQMGIFHQAERSHRAKRPHQAKRYLSSVSVTHQAKRPQAQYFLLEGLQMWPYHKK